MRTLFVFFTNLIVYSQAIASWPIFSVPHPQDLIIAETIETRECPLGFGKVSQGTLLPVRKNVPINSNSWYWQVTNNTECFDITALQLADVKIEKINGDTELHDRSGITAYYSVNTSFVFALHFITPPQHWTCMEISQQHHVVTCANDM